MIATSPSQTSLPSLKTPPLSITTPIPTMAGDDTSKRRPSRRDRDREKPRGRDRSSSRDSGDPRGSRDSGDVIPYPDDDDRRPPPPPPQRSSTYNGVDRQHRRRNRSYSSSGSETDVDSRDRRSRASEKSRRRRSVSSERTTRPRSRTRRGGDTRRRSASRSGDRPLTEEEMKSRRKKAIQAAVMAGALEVMRQSRRPGEWMGQKGVRVATAAISAGLIDAGLDKNPGIAGGTMGRLMTSTLGGMVVDKIANGGSTGRKR